MIIAGLHPYHVSATEMEYDEVQKRVEISAKVFTDDFENILTKLYKQKVDLHNENTRPQTTALINKYMQSHLSLGTDGKVLPLELFGWEIDHEAVYIYMIAKAEKFNVNNIALANTILYDLFDDQINIIHFLYKGKRISTKLVYPDKRASISFNK